MDSPATYHAILDIRLRADIPVQMFSFAIPKYRVRVPPSVPPSPGSSCNFYDLLNSPQRPTGGAIFFRFEPFPDLSTHACPIWSRSDRCIRKKRVQTDRHTHKGTLQFYIIVNAGAKRSIADMRERFADGRVLFPDGKEDWMIGIFT